MARKAGTLETLARQIGLALQPLQTQLTPANIVPLLSQLGLTFPPQLTAQAGFMGAVSAGASAAGTISNLLNQLATDITNDNEAGILQDGIQLIHKIADVITALGQIGTKLASAGNLPDMNAGEVASFAQNLAPNLLSYLVISYSEKAQPGAVAVANLLGCLDYIREPGNPADPTHPPFVQRRLQLSRIGDLLKNPAGLLRTLYGWGDPGFDCTQLVPRLNDSLNLLGLHSRVPQPPKSLDLILFSVQANPASDPPGLSVTSKIDIPGGVDLTFPLGTIWSVHFQAQATFAAGLQATINPPANVTLKPPTGTLDGLLQTDLMAKGPDANHPIILIGQTGGSRLQTDSFSFGAGLAVTWDSGSGSAAAEPVINMEVKGEKVVIDMSNADGFLATVLSGVVDLAKMLVMEFALIFGNDWFTVPVPTQFGSLSRVTTLVVTDTFGVRTVIRPSEQTQVNAGESPWSMYKLSGPTSRSDFIMMAPTLGVVDDAAPLEEVLFLRDDMAAMAWAVEHYLHGELDASVDAHEMYLARLKSDPPPKPPIAASGGPKIYYSLETPVPDNWIPMVPVQTPAGELYLRRGTMEVPTSTGLVNIRARALILEPGRPFFLADRVVSRAGVLVDRYFRRTRSTDGTIFVWMARKSGQGRGPGWSGLRFDLVRDMARAANR